MELYTGLRGADMVSVVCEAICAFWWVITVVVDVRNEILAKY